MRWARGITAGLAHYLDERGRIAAPSRGAQIVAEHLAAIVVMTTGNLATPADGAPGSVRCRARPNHKPCLGFIDSDVLPDAEGDIERIHWWCKRCTSNGVISDWQGTFWDMSDSPAKLAQIRALDGH